MMHLLRLFFKGTKMENINLNATIEELSQKGLVSIKSYTDGAYAGLRVVKYSKKVFYDKLWNEYPILEELRGVVLDSEGNIIAYPFTKVYNYGENNTFVERDKEVTAVRKVNGFLGVVSVWKGELLFSTTGTLDSEFARMAKESILTQLAGNILVTGCDDARDNGVVSIMEYLKQYLLDANSTLMFEIVHPNDPHIVAETSGVYLIGMRKNEIGSSLVTEQKLNDIAYVFNFIRPTHTTGRFSDILAESKGVTHEGFIIRDARSGAPLCKIKSVHYSTKKFLMRGKSQLGRLFSNPEGFKKECDEEWYGLVDFLSTAYTHAGWTSLDDQNRRAIIEGFFAGSTTDNGGDLILLRGLPGAGKSTVATLLVGNSDTHIEADQYFVDSSGNYNWDSTKLRDAHSDCILRVSKQMQYGVRTIVVSNTLTQPWEMDKYYAIAKQFGYKVHSLIVENRHNSVSVHNVPAETVQKMRDRFDVKL